MRARRVLCWLLITLVVSLGTVLVFGYEWLATTTPGALVLYRLGDEDGRVPAAVTLLQSPRYRSWVVTTFQDDPSAEVRRAVAMMIAVHYPEHVDVMVESMLNDPSSRVRLWCAKKVREAGRHARPAIPALIKVLSDEELRVSEEAMWSLEKLTGLRFDSTAVDEEGARWRNPAVCQDDWHHWWEENNERLVWDERLARFVLARKEP